LPLIRNPYYKSYRSLGLNPNALLIDDYKSTVTAKKIYRETAENAVANELRRAKVPEKAIKELMGFCVSINKNDLRALISQDQTQWPKELGDYEIHERGLLRFLARITP
jgi:hypothetical protein